MDDSNAQLYTFGRHSTGRGKYEAEDIGHSIAPGEMSFYSSILLPLFTILLAIACLVVSFYDPKSFTKQSYARVYLITSAIILFIDFACVFTESLLAKRQVNIRWVKFQKFSIIFLLVSYIFLAIFGSFMISNVSEYIKSSKDNAPVSLAFITVYFFIVCRTLIDIGSFVAFWMFQCFKNSSESEALGITDTPSSPNLEISEDDIDLNEKTK